MSGHTKCMGAALKLRSGVSGVFQAASARHGLRCPLHGSALSPMRYRNPLRFCCYHLRKPTSLICPAL